MILCLLQRKNPAYSEKIEVLGLKNHQAALQSLAEALLEHFIMSY